MTQYRLTPEQAAHIKFLVETDLSIKNTQIYLACANGLPDAYVKKLEKEKELDQTILTKLLTAKNKGV